MTDELWDILSLMGKECEQNTKNIIFYERRAESELESYVELLESDNQSNELISILQSILLAEASA